MPNKHFLPTGQPVTWRRYCRGGWAVMASLNRQTRIGVLSVAMLATVQLQAATGGGKCEVRMAAEQGDSAALGSDTVLDEVTVTGTVAPLTALQAARIVQVITSDDIRRSSAQTVADILKSATGVDVRQRGGFGIQTDISIDGCTFDQITVLLNGIDITSPQTGHHSADFPVSPADIERIEILEGAAGRAYGNAAFGGAVNIVTKKSPLPTSPRGGAITPSHSGEGWGGGLQAGSYGTFGAEASGSFCGQSLSAAYTQSDGGTDNSDFRRVNAFASGTLGKRNVMAFWQAGLVQKQYGANTFYSAAYPDQWEGERRYIASLTADATVRLDGVGTLHVCPTAYWQRAADHFQLTRGKSAGENFHRSDVYGIELKAHLSWLAGKTAVGADIRQEGILSTGLGRAMDSTQWVPLRFHDDINYTHRDNRTQVGYFLEHNVLLSHWTISAGVRAVMNTAAGNTMRLYPGIDIAWRPGTKGWRVFASYNKGFRMPTFTDLYYKSPTQEGNQGLRPEESHSVQLGVGVRHGWLDVTARTFLHRGRRMIDWVMYSANDKYHSTSFDLDNLGAQLNATARWQRDVTLSVGYTYIHQWRHDAQPVYKSNYALEYLRHKFTASLSHPFAPKGSVMRSLQMQWSVRVCDRNGTYIDQPTGQLTDYTPYAVLDAKLMWAAPHYTVWFSGENLTSHRYYDLGNIPQPGFWLMGGVTLTF